MVSVFRRSEYGGLTALKPMSSSLMKTLGLDCSLADECAYNTIGHAYERKMTGSTHQLTVDSYHQSFDQVHERIVSKLALQEMTLGRWDLQGLMFLFSK